MAGANRETWTAQRNRVAALAARLPGAGTVLRIEGGLPRAKPQPPGHELKSQHAAFAKAAQVGHAAATAVAAAHSRSKSGKPS